MNIRMVPIVRTLLILIGILFLFVAIRQGLGEDKPTAPKLTAEQKLEIRSAQVALFQAKEVLESTPQFKAFQEAQSHLNETALKVQRESKVDPAKWILGQDLEYTAVPEKK